MKPKPFYFATTSRALILAFVSVMAWTELSQAQTGTSASDTGNRANILESVFGLGANFSPLSGMGLSVRQHLAAKLSWMVDGYYAKTTDGSNYSYGLELQYDLILKDRVRFYVLGGASYYYGNQRFTAYNSADGSQYDAFSGNTFTGPTRLGGGFGIETNLIGDDFCILADLVFVSYQPTGEFIPSASGGVHYYFR